MLSNKIKTVIAGSILCGLVFCGCNTQENSTAKESAQAKTDTVLIDQMQFSPAEITINKGDTVLFINNDLVAHDATEVNKAWQSPTLQSGDSWKTVPEKTADYYCSIHLVMKGKIVVQ